jgi:hypothetical protein
MSRLVLPLLAFVGSTRSRMVVRRESRRKRRAGVANREGDELHFFQ